MSRWFNIVFDECPKKVLRYEFIETDGTKTVPVLTGIERSMSSSNSSDCKTWKRKKKSNKGH